MTDLENRLESELHKIREGSGLIIRKCSFCNSSLFYFYNITDCKYYLSTGCECVKGNHFTEVSEEYVKDDIRSIYGL